MMIECSKVLPTMLKHKACSINTDMSLLNIICNVMQLVYLMKLMLFKHKLPMFHHSKLLSLVASAA